MFVSRNLDLGGRKAIAAAKNTPAEVLEQLAQDADAQVRSIVASNPNTPTEVLLKLAEEFPDKVIGNPMFNLLLLENSANDSISLLSALNPTTPVQKLVVLAVIAGKRVSDSNRRILAVVAHNRNTPDSLLQEIFVYVVHTFNHNANRHIYRAIARNPNASPELLDRFVTYNPDTSGDPILRQQFELIDWFFSFGLLDDLACHPNTPASLLEKLAVVGDENVRHSVRLHPNALAMSSDFVSFINDKPEALTSCLQELFDQGQTRDLVEHCERTSWSLSSLKTFFKV